MEFPHRLSVSQKRTQSIAALAAGAALLLAIACGSSAPPLVFASDRDGNREIYSVNVGGRGGAVNLTNTPQSEHSPVLSPDGKLVAFLSGSGNDTALEVMRTNGNDRKKVSVGGGTHKDVRWSPDSRRLAYVVENSSGSRVYVAQADGGEVMLLSSVRGDEVGDWSPDGNAVIFSVAEGDERGLYIRNPDGVNEFRRTETPDSRAVYSPDSRKLAFISTRDGNPEVYVMNAGGGEAVRITETTADERDVSWSPDGRTILFVSERDGNPEIYTVAIENDNKPSNLRRLTHNDVPDEQPVWSKNGKQIAFVSYLDGDAEIFVMGSDGGNQNRVTNNNVEDVDPSW